MFAGKGFTPPHPGAYDALMYKGALDCSTNPNYPAADAGHVYIVSVAGKVGGASGIGVTIGTVIICRVDGTVAGTQAAVGANWTILASSSIGAMTTATDPASNAACTTAIVDSYVGTIITTTGAGNSQTIGSPTTVTAGRTFTVVNAAASTHSIPIVANSITFTVTPGESQSFIWDGAAWGPYDLGITAIPVTVVQGGSGRSTGTTAYCLIATGTTATGAQQSLAVGATTEMLVGGGASALPVWTTCTGSGAPVRAVSPALTGVPTAPTATTGTNTTQLATTAFVQTEVTAVGIATVGAADCENIVEDLSWLPPVTFTWDPGSLNDGVGETSSAIAVPGAVLGSTIVQCVAPYDLQGITLSAWVDAANSCKARLQNETAGVIDLASGTWVMQGRRI